MQQQYQTMDLVTLERIVASEHKKKTEPHLRVVLPNAHAGGIIGFKGQNARRIQSSFNVFLQLFSTEGQKWGRLLSLRGQPEQLGKAWYECALLLIENYKPYYDTRGFSINFLFPTDLIDLLLSQDEFQRIANTSHSRILVKNACLYRSTERVVRVEIPDFEPESLLLFQIATTLLAKSIQDNITLAMCAPGNKYYTEEKSDNIYHYMLYMDKHNDIIFDPDKVEQEFNNNNNNSTTVVEDDSVIREQIMKRLIYDTDNEEEDRYSKEETQRLVTETEEGEIETNVSAEGVELVSTEAGSEAKESQVSETKESEGSESKESQGSEAKESK